MCLWDDIIVFWSLELPWEKPLIPFVRSLNKFQSCFLRNWINWHPNRANIFTIYWIVSLIMMPWCWNFSRWLFNQDMLMIKHTTKLYNSLKMYLAFICFFFTLSLTSSIELQLLQLESYLHSQLIQEFLSNYSSHWNKHPHFQLAFNLIASLNLEIIIEEYAIIP